MEEIFNLVGSLGFPIAISLYVLVRMEKTIKENTKAIVNLSIALATRK